jgi:hypothetical protein
MSSPLLTTRSRHRVNQAVEHLRLDGDGLETAARLAPIGIKHVIGRDKLHVGAPNQTAKPPSRDIDLKIGDAEFQRSFPLATPGLRQAGSGA